MAGVASDDRQIQLDNRILRPINGLRYTRQPSCIFRANTAMLKNIILPKLGAKKVDTIGRRRR
jgi:hypothetical protein